VLRFEQITGDHQINYTYGYTRLMTMFNLWLCSAIFNKQVFTLHKYINAISFKPITKKMKTVLVKNPL